MDKFEHLKNISIAATSAIPLIGGPVSVLLDKYLPNFIAERRDYFLNELEVELSSLIERKMNPTISDDKFIAVFIKCLRLATEESETEKIDAFKNIILNVSITNDSEFDETTLFMNWVRSFTVDQIRILKAIQVDSSISQDDSTGPDIYFLLKKYFPDVPRDYLMICSQDLVSQNLVMYGKGMRAAELDQKNNKTWFLSNMGERFIKFIKSPNNDMTKT